VTETPGAQPNPEPDQTPPPPGGYQAPPPPSGDQAPPAGYQAPPPGYQAPPPGYQAPPPGYQAPPPGYQAPPPGYQAPPPGYQAPPPGYGPPANQVNVGDAFGWGWAKFQQNVGPYLLGMIIYAVLGGILIGIPYAILIAGASTTLTIDANGNITSGAGGLFGASIGAMIVVWILAIVVEMLAQVGLINASLRVANGERISVGTFFNYPNLGNVIATALLVGVATFVGTLVTFFIGGLGGVVVGFFALFALFLAVDQGYGPMDAIKASFSLVSKNFGPTILVFLVAMVAMAIGGILLGLGLLVAVPLSMLAFTFLYRRLVNGPLAA